MHRVCHPDDDRIISPKINKKDLCLLRLLLLLVHISRRVQTKGEGNEMLSTIPLKSTE